MGFSVKNGIAQITRGVVHQIKDLALLTAYFYVSFVAVIFFKATVLHSYGIYYVVWGTAIVKAILIAKFMLIGQSMKIADIELNGPLIKPILYKLFGFLSLLLFFTSAEEMATGLLHHRSIHQVLDLFTGPRLGVTIAEVLILMLVLIPFIVFSVIAEALGENSLQQMLFKGGVLAPSISQSKLPPRCV